MTRLALILIVLAGALPAAAAAAPAVPQISIGLDECVATSPGAGGSAIFRARMVALPSTDRMLVRFDLQVREPGAADWSPVSTEPNGWIKSAPGVSQLIWHKRFEALGGPAVYRARVRFRWYDASGALIDDAERRTPICAQPDPRPNLELGTLTVQPAGSGQPGQLRYAIPVRNTGRGDAGAFDVAFTLVGEPKPLIASVSGLAAGDSQSIAVVAPRCQPGEQLRVEVDPGNRVDEAGERDNVLTIACPPLA